MTTTFSNEHSLTPKNYQALVRERFQQLPDPEHERVALAQANGRVLTEDILAPENVPAFPNSQMDGYALTAHAAVSTSRIFTVGADIAAGASLKNFVPEDGIAYPIMTGAEVPAGLSAVVPEEKCEPQGEKDGSFAAFQSEVYIPTTQPGQFVRQPGEDIKAGEILARAGEKISAVLVGALAAQGIKEVTVQGARRVLVVTGGDEVAANDTLAPSHIRDANGPMLIQLLAEDSAISKHLHIQDDPQKLIHHLDQAIHEFSPHLIISSGGISHGKFEVIKNAIHLLMENPTELTVQKLWFGHVSQQPGGPQGIMELAHRGSSENILWLAFPGNPVSSLISYRMFLRPHLNTSWYYTGIHLGKLQTAEPLEGLAGKTQYRRATITRASSESNATAEWLIEPDPQTGSHLLHRAAQANALVEIEPNKHYTNGDILRWYPLSTIETM